MIISRRIFLAATAAGLALAPSCAPRRTGGDLNAILDRVATQLLQESPEAATALAVSEERAGGPFITRLSDVSKAGVQHHRGILEAALTELRAIDRATLSPQDAISRDVVLAAFQDELEALQFEFGRGATSPYPVTQLNGAYTSIPDFLDSQHPITNPAEAEAYLARLSAYARQMDQETARISEDAGAGVVPPDFAVDGAIRQLEGFIASRPAETVLVQSIARRDAEVAAIAAADRTDMNSRAEALVRDEVFPAYARQIAALRAIRGRATHDAGVWKLPRGAELYTAALKYFTSTTMSADEVHSMGVDLVGRINGEMDAILRAQGLTRGSVADRYRSVMARRDQLYPNTDAGRAQLLGDLNRQVQEIRALMPRVCGTLARADLEIKRVPAYTEAGAPGGYYNSGALDGSRPGAYYINLRDTGEWPRFTLPTLTYHEGIPGHHWQIAIAQEAQGLPFIRSALLGFNAYTEGWALYAEQLADEMGVYADDPLGRLGYLQSAAFRASRLVVDTGMHAKRWSREQAIQSMLESTGDHESSIVTEIERYAVLPGQACGYMIGRQVINRLRDEARAALGESFDIKGFHDTVLTNGAVPLTVLETIVRDWIAEQRGPTPAGDSRRSR